MKTENDFFGPSELTADEIDRILNSPVVPTFEVVEHCEQCDKEAKEIEEMFNENGE